MRQYHKTLEFSTNGRGFLDVTHTLRHWVTGTGTRNGLLTILCMHTSASLTIQENADPDVLRDLADFLDRLAPEGKGLYRHSAEGPDDMPAHIRAALTQTSLSLPVVDSHMQLGTWQAVYLIEHRAQPHKRRLACHLLGL